MTAARHAPSAVSAVTPDQPIARVTDVTGRIEARKVIDHAKGLLMSQRRMTEPEAYRWIQKSAMDRRTPMAVVAGQILQGFGDNASRAS